MACITANAARTSLYLLHGPGLSGLADVIILFAQELIYGNGFFPGRSDMDVILSIKEGKIIILKIFVSSEELDFSLALSEFTPLVDAPSMPLLVTRPIRSGALQILLVHIFYIFSATP